MFLCSSHLTHEDDYTDHVLVAALITFFQHQMFYHRANYLFLRVTRSKTTKKGSINDKNIKPIEFSKNDTLCDLAKWMNTLRYICTTWKHVDALLTLEKTKWLKLKLSNLYDKLWGNNLKVHSQRFLFCSLWLPVYLLQKADILSKNTNSVATDSLHTYVPYIHNTADTTTFISGP